MIRLVVLCGILLSGLQLAAQGVLDSRDSIFIKQLFFAGLGEKLKQDYSGSKGYFEKITAIDPGNHAAWYELSLLDYRQNDLAGAGFAINKATALAPQNAWYQRLSGEISRTSQAVRKPPGTAAMSAVLLGDSLYSSGRPHEALKAYQQALKTDKGLYAIWEKVIQLQLMEGQYQQLIQTTDSALAIFPGQGMSYYYQAFALHHSGQNQKALGHIASAVQLQRGNPEVLSLIYALQAGILIDQRQPDAAIQAFNLALEADPGNYEAVNNYAYYLALQGRQSDKALALIRMAADARPGDASIADTYALILFNKGDYAGAKTWVEKALENKDAVNSVYLEHYGDILYLGGEQEKGWLQWKRSRAAGNDSAVLKRKINEKKYYK